MAATDLTSIMQAIADQLVDAEVVPDAYPWPFGGAEVGSAIVDYPEPIDLDAAVGGGAGRLQLAVYVIVGLPTEEEPRAVASGFISTGALSVKAALDGDLGGTCQSARVMTAEIVVTQLAAVDYLAAKFVIDILT